MKKAISFLLLYSFLFQISTISAHAEQPAKPEVASEAAILMDADTGVVLYQKNMYERLYPASITKVLTALTILDHMGGKMDSRIAFSPASVDLPPDSSGISMQAGDTLSLQEALYGLMISSANEVANALAESVGPPENFMAMANRKAASLGANGTHFVNPSGLHDESHYTCAYDMALIMREAVKNPFFLDAASKLYYEIPPTETQPEPRSLYSKNKILLPDSAYHRDYFTASKTGWTSQSGHTLVSFAQKDGHNLITVVLHAEKNVDYQDTIAMMDYGFGSFHYANILEAANVVTSAKVQLDPNNPKSSRSIALYAKEGVEGEFPACITEYSVALDYYIPDVSTPPVQEGDKLGTLLVNYQGITLKKIDLYAAETVLAPELTAAPESAAEPPKPNSPNGSRYAGGFSFDFLGSIVSSALESFSPLQLNAVYFMIILIFVMMLAMAYWMNFIIHGRGKDKEKDLLKYVNRARKK